LDKKYISWEEEERKMNLKKERYYNKEEHGIDIFINEDLEDNEGFPYQVLAILPDGTEVNYGWCDSHYVAQKICHWLYGGILCTGYLPTIDDLNKAKPSLGLR
jgi:hypothetical protein